MWFMIKSTMWSFPALLLIVLQCEGQIIDIIPKDVQRIQLGSSIAHICETIPPLNVSMRWKDPEGKVIKEKKAGSKANGSNISKVSTNHTALYLIINNITENLSGTYTCEAVHLSKVISGTIDIETFAPLDWSNLQTEQYATVGQNYLISCDVTGDSELIISWYRNATQVVNDERHLIDTGGLIILDVDEDHNGDYTCQAVGKGTSEMSSRIVTVTVISAPEMDVIQRAEFVREGDILEIPCNASGTPEPEYVWLKHPNEKALQNGTRILVDEDTHTLTIEDVQVDDMGIYYCIAKNRAGENRTLVDVKVIVPPRIVQLSNITAVEKTNIKLQCTAEGLPSPNIRIHRYTDELERNDSRFSFNIDFVEDNMLMVSIATLKITNLNRSDAGTYECIASNTDGEANATTDLIVHYQPSFALSNLTIWSWNSRTVNLSCTSQAMPEASITWLFRTVELKESTPHIKIHSSGSTSYLIVTPTNHSLYGLYECVASNVLGLAVLTIYLQEGHPPGPITDVFSDPKPATSLLFAIVGPTEVIGPPVLGYTAQYDESTVYNHTHIHHNRSWALNRPFVLEKLKSATTYFMNFAAINAVGVGPWSPLYNFTTMQRSAPEQLEWQDITNPDTVVQSIENDYFDLRWKAPEDNGETISGYVVQFCNVTKINDSGIRMDNDCVTEEFTVEAETTYRLLKLLPDRTYRVSLQARNALGVSSPTILYFRTTPELRITPSLSTSTTVGVAIAVALLCLLLIDLILLVFCQKGLIKKYFCKSSGNEINGIPQDKDKKELLKEKTESTIVDYPLNNKTTGGITGKHSSV